MNQILYSGGKKEKNNITKIVKAFCIIIIVFSLFFIVQGTYALVTKDSKTKIGAKSDSTPNVNVTSQGGKAILDISHSKGISKVEYSWNDGEKTSIDENTSKSEFIIAKHRNGPTTTVDLIFKRNTSTFVNMLKED